MNRVLVVAVVGLAFLCGLLAPNARVETLSAQAEKGESKGPKWVHGIDLRVRPVGQGEWKNAPITAVEVFEDPVNGNLIYINDRGGMAVLPRK